MTEQTQKFIDAYESLTRMLRSERWSKFEDAGGGLSNTQTAHVSHMGYGNEIDTVYGFIRLLEGFDGGSKIKLNLFGPEQLNIEHQILDGGIKIWYPTTPKTLGLICTNGKWTQTVLPKLPVSGL